jgi:hypothetical protein
MGKISKNKILVELINNQIENIDNNKKLDVKSLQRISRNVENSLFSNECVFWQGYITYIQSTDVHYINFFFNGKKHALHRLLYLNFIGDLKKNEYLKYKCENKGKCCNINHILKINSKNKSLEKDQIEKKIDSNNKNKNTIELISDNKKNDKLIIIF